MEKIKVTAYNLLRKSEKIFKTDMVYLAHGGFWLVLGQVVQMASGLAVSVVFANLVSKEVYGTYQFIMSMAAIMSGLTLTGMNTALTRAVARGSEGALRYAFRTEIAWSSGVVFAGAALGIYYFTQGNITLALSFIIVGALSPFLGAFGLTQSYFFGKKLFKENVLLGIGRRLVPIACIITTLFLTQNLLVIVFVYFASNTLSAGLLYYLVVKRYNLPCTENKEMVNYSKHLSFLKTFTDVFVSQADDVLIFHFLGAAPVATYVLAQLPVTNIEVLFKLLLSLALPKHSVSTLAELKRTLPRKVNILLAGTVVIVIAYILLVPFLFKIFFPQYLESIIFSQVLALTLLSKPRSLYGQVFTAQKMKRELYILNLSPGILRLILLVILLPLYGIWGAIYSVLGTHIYSNIVTRYLFYKAGKQVKTA